MISNNKTRLILGEKYTHLTDDELEELKKQLYVFGFGMFEIWKRDKIDKADAKTSKSSDN